MHGSSLNICTKLLAVLLSCAATWLSIAPTVDAQTIPVRGPIRNFKRVKVAQRPGNLPLAPAGNFQDATNQPQANQVPANTSDSGANEAEKKRDKKSTTEKSRKVRGDAPCLCWVKAGVPTRAVVLCIHGLGLNSSSWEQLGQKLSEKGVVTYAIDVRGFGSWMAAKGHHDVDFKACLEDVNTTLQWIHRANPGKPVFLLGESMGGAIALQATAEYPSLVDGLISACASGDRFKQKKMDLKVGLHMLTGMNRDFNIGSSIVNQATDNAELKAEWEGDPLNRMKLSPKELLQFQKFMNENHEKAKLITKTPVLMVQGSKDGLVKPEGTEELFNELATPDKELLMVPNGEHLIFEEGQFTDDVMRSVAIWVIKHAPVMQQAAQMVKGARRNARSGRRPGPAGGRMALAALANGAPLGNGAPFANGGPLGNAGPLGSGGPLANGGPPGNAGPLGNGGPFANSGPPGNAGPLGNGGPFANSGPLGNAGSPGNGRTPGNDVFVPGGGQYNASGNNTPPSTTAPGAVPYGSANMQPDQNAIAAGGTASSPPVPPVPPQAAAAVPLPQAPQGGAAAIGGQNGQADQGGGAFAAVPGQFLNQAKQLLAAGKPKMAQRMLEAELQISPNNPEANFLLGQIHLQTQNFQLARHHLGRAIRQGSGTNNATMANQMMMTMPRNFLAPRTAAAGAGSSQQQMGQKRPRRGNKALIPAGSEQPTVIVFNAKWCEPGKDMAIVVKEAEQRFPSVKFIQIDVDDPKNSSLVDKYSIGPVPTTVFLNSSGEVADFCVGYAGVDGMINGMSKIVPDR